MVYLNLSLHLQPNVKVSLGILFLAVVLLHFFQAWNRLFLGSHQKVSGIRLDANKFGQVK